MGRPKGTKDSKPRKKKKKIQPKKQAQTRPEPPEITPYPKAGDNPEFEGMLDRMDLDETKPQERIIQKPGEPSLDVKDVAEWVSWPFLAWSQYNKMPSLVLEKSEAVSIAQPLTNILNRHGVGDVVSPDLLDGLKLAARLTVSVSERVKMIQIERKMRAGNQEEPVNKPVDASQGGRTSTKINQGAPFREPEKVSH